MGKYYLTVFDTITQKEVETEVSEEIYNEYRRMGWRMDKRESTYKKQVTVFSALKGGENNAFENFHEFLDTQNNPEHINMMSEEKRILKNAFHLLSQSEKELITALIINGKSEREYSAETGIPQKTTNNRKKAILLKLNKFIKKVAQI